MQLPHPPYNLVIFYTHVSTSYYVSRFYSGTAAKALLDDEINLVWAKPMLLCRFIFSWLLPEKIIVHAEPNDFSVTF